MKTDELTARIIDLESEVELFHENNKKLIRENMFLKHILQKEGIDISAYTSD